MTLLEADTDGVYFSVPDTWTESDERRVVGQVAALLPPLVQLELEGRYRAMLSHEPKNYALLGYDGTLHLRGVAFRSSRSEPFGDRFLREAVRRLLVGDVHGVREAYTSTIGRLRARALPTWDVSSLVRLTKEPAEYLEARARRRELAYEALIATGSGTWRAGDRVRVYRKRNGEGGVVASSEDDATADDPRDYDAEYYVRLLRSSYAERLARAFTAEDFAVVFADAEQMDLLAPPVAGITPILRTLPVAAW